MDAIPTNIYRDHSLLLLVFLSVPTRTSISLLYPLFHSKTGNELCLIVKGMGSRCYVFCPEEVIVAERRAGGKYHPQAGNTKQKIRGHDSTKREENVLEL